MAIKYNQHWPVFGTLQQEGYLESHVQALMERAPDSVTTLGITRSGFMQLQAMMIQQLRLDICWNMLRSFGYNRQLHLDPSVYDLIPEQPGSVVRSLPTASADQRSNTLATWCI